MALKPFTPGVPLQYKIVNQRPVPGIHHSVMCSIITPANGVIASCIGMTKWSKRLKKKKSEK